MSTLLTCLTWQRQHCIGIAYTSSVNSTISIHLFVRRAPVLEVVVEAIVLGSEKQQAAALGIVAVVITSMEDINDSILIYATFQDMIEYKQCVALSTSLCTQLLQHDEEQVWCSTFQQSRYKST